MISFLLQKNHLKTLITTFLENVTTFDNVVGLTVGSSTSKVLSEFTVTS